jgi:hypothetical protein
VSNPCQLGDLRPGWVFHVIAECQRFSSAWLSTDLRTVEDGARHFTSRLERPIGSFESQWLRMVLVEVAVKPLHSFMTTFIESMGVLAISFRCARSDGIRGSRRRTPAR